MNDYNADPVEYFYSAMCEAACEMSAAASEEHRLRNERDAMHEEMLARGRRHPKCELEPLRRLDTAIQAARDRYNEKWRSYKRFRSAWRSAWWKKPSQRTT